MGTNKFLFLFPAIFLFSQPQQPTLMRGEASFSIQSPELLEIVTSHQAMIEWSEFNIEPTEITRFIQPSTDSCVLNRVFDALPSRLMGRLESNGQVILVNPNGILIGKNAMIDTGSLIASTLDCKSFDRELVFEGSSQGVTSNQGSIRASHGDVLLIGCSVENEGSIETDGFVGLIASSAVSFQPSGIDRLYLRGHSFSDVFVHEATHQGSIRAKDVCVLGERVQLKDHSQIDVSGGTVLIGGDRQGQNPHISNAKIVWMDPGASISANGNDGGTVVLWGDEACGFFGTISSRGLEGRGGFVEVSSKGVLAVEGMIDVAALSGRGGQILLDPTNVTIGGANAGFVVTACPAANFNFGANPTSTISIATLTGLLGTAGCTVTINTSVSTALSAGTITVASPFTWATDADLNLVANSTITVNPGADITPTGAGTITFNAGGNILIRAMVRNSAAAGAAGDVILIAPTGSTITITDAGGTSAIGVGSQNGLTMIGNPAVARCQRTRPNVDILAGNHPNGGTTLGRMFFGNEAGPFTAVGPIDVTCRVLNVLGSTGTAVTSSASIGHVGHGVPPSPTNLTTSAAATITVDADRDITVSTGDLNKDAFIGHGGRFNNGGNLSGNICVSTTGSVFVQHLPTTGGACAVIGHGLVSLSSGGANTNADVTVQAVGNITLQNNVNVAAAGNFAGCCIGHGSGDGHINTRNGNIYVICGGNLTMTTAFLNNPIRGNNVFIGHSAFDSYSGISHTLSVSQSNIYVSVDGNVTITGNSSGTIGIGTIVQNTLTQGVLEMLVGGNFTVTSGSGNGASPVNIGNVDLTGAVPATGNTNIAVMGDLTITPSAIGQSIQFTASQDVNLAVGGNIIGTGSGVAALGQSYISTVSTTIGSTRVRAGGSITANRGSLNIPLLIGTRTAPPAAPPLMTTGSLRVQASGSLQILNGFRTTSGTIELASGIPFIVGDLWTVANSQLTSVAGQAVAVLPFSGCAPCAGFLGAVLTNSAAVPTGCLCPTFNTTDANGNLFQTTVGNITFESSTCNNCVACANPSASIGQALGETVDIRTVAGDVTITMFRDLTVNAALTGNDFFISTCRNFTLSAGRSITATGNVDIIVDQAFPVSPLIGPGAFSTAAGSSIVTAGYLRIYTSQQNLNSILGTLNGIAFVPGTLFQDTNQEIWCTYFPTPLNGVPFTISYKNCFQAVITQAQTNIVQFNVTLHPYNEYPGWEERFLVKYAGFGPIADAGYSLRRRNLQSINQPKTWTLLMPE